MTRADRRLSEGRTVWRKAALVALPAVAAVAAMAVAMGEGVLASSFAVSGQAFQVSSSRLTSKGLVSFVDVDRSADGRGHATALLGVGDATLTDICQAARVNTPLGTVVFSLRAGGEAGNVMVSNLVLHSEDLMGDARFGEVQLGRDASTLDQVPGVRGAPGQFGLQAASVTVSGVRSHTWSVTGGDFRLKGLRLDVGLNDRACF
ncbi:cholesterol esterase [Streptomyces cinnamoneus]|uniref:Cholesterol esterase n=1 Tax=Streptomyces cinnamoneus TaxID=53446 RepID=A0A2G1XNT9_STRCJ|nr:DUF6230 family protein [Streptomyces cinnamoneus]PHQ52898.1 cholesterol esterase [Streptomyces cinnamoneus]PPT11442.1 cholesterol esterase [Streptomyces cinnamoneus]